MNESYTKGYKSGFLQAVYNHKEAIVFFNHIKKHIANGDTGDINHLPQCKICKKTVDLMIKEIS